MTDKQTTDEKTSQQKRVNGLVRIICADLVHWPNSEYDTFADTLRWVTECLQQRADITVPGAAVLQNYRDERLATHDE